MPLTLIEALQQVEDFRAKRGQRYPLWVILLLVVLGTLNGATSYQALEEFAQRHYPALVDHLRLPYKRLPSDSTLRRVLMGVDFRQLAQAFTNWAKPYLERDEARWFAIDGKGLNGSITAPCEAHQQFVNLVSVFSHAQGIVVAMEQYRSNQGSEIAVVEALIAALDLQAVTYTMDAAHAQKKRSRPSSSRATIT
jgi:DDE_Tnp_1-associated